MSRSRSRLIFTALFLLLVTLAFSQSSPVAIVPATGNLLSANIGTTINIPFSVALADGTKVPATTDMPISVSSDSGLATVDLTSSQIQVSSAVASPVNVVASLNGTPTQLQVAFSDPSATAVTQAPLGFGPPTTVATPTLLLVPDSSVIAPGQIGTLTAIVGPGQYPGSDYFISCLDPWNRLDLIPTVPVFTLTATPFGPVQVGPVHPGQPIVVGRYTAASSDIPGSFVHWECTLQNLGGTVSAAASGRIYIASMQQMLSISSGSDGFYPATGELRSPAVRSVLSLHEHGLRQRVARDPCSARRRSGRLCTAERFPHSS